MQFDNSLTILHFSDLHFGYFSKFKNKPSTYIDCCKNILSEISKFFDNNDLDSGRILIISGDVGSKGLREDYVSERNLMNASSFLNIYFKEFIPQHIFLVPGNHDLLWAGRQGATKQKRFHEYYQFLKKLKVIKKIPEYYDRPHFWNKIPDLKAIIMGLNSCMYTSYSEDTKKGKYYENLQFRSYLNGEKILNTLQLIPEISFHEPYIRIAVLHHNIIQYEGEFVTIYDGNKKPEFTLVERLSLDFHFDLIFHGHRHSKFFQQIEKACVIGAGSLLVEPSQRENRKNSFNIVQVQKGVVKSGLHRFWMLNIKVIEFIINYDDDYSVKYSSSEEKEIIRSITYNEDKEKMVRVRKKLMEDPTNIEFAHSIIIAAKKLPNAQKYNFESQIRRDIQHIYDKIEDKTPIIESIFQKYRVLINERKPGTAKSYLIKSLSLIEKAKASIDIIQNKLDQEVAEKIVKDTQFKTYFNFEDLQSGTTMKTGEVMKPTITGGSVSEYISWSPIRRLMKHNGAIIVAREAVDELVDWMSVSAVKITKSAMALTKHSKRKKLTKDDILLAIKYF